MSGPDPRERDLVKCEDMRIHAERAREFLGSRSLEELLADKMVQDAVIRCVEVVGEAARLVSEETRQRAPGIPWSLIGSEVVRLILHRPPPLSTPDRTSWEP